MIKFLDIYKQDKKIINSILFDLKRIIFKNNFILGDQVSKFEKKFANFCGTKFCIGVASGLDALSLVLRAWIEMGKLNRGDHVIVPSNTYIASILAIANNGLKPILVEPDIQTYNISPKLIRKNISKKQKQY